MTEPTQVIGQRLPEYTVMVQVTTLPTGAPLVGRQRVTGKLMQLNGGMTTLPPGVGMGIGPVAVQVTGCGTAVLLQRPLLFHSILSWPAPCWPSLSPQGMD